MSQQGVTAKTASETPLLALHAVALDTETTGLNIKQDRVIQIGAVRIAGRVVRSGDAFDTLVNPQVKIPAASQKIHHINDGMVVDAPTVCITVPKGRIVMH